MDYKIGDEVWYSPPNSFLAIRCEITEIDDYFRKQHPEAYLCYWIDEPVGNGLSDDEFFTSKEEIEEYFREEYPLDLLSKNLKLDEQLLDFRKRRATFIVSTWNIKSEVERANKIEEILNFYPNKKHGDHWFNIADMAL